jgi:SSS family solute:Na+ symporter
MIPTAISFFDWLIVAVYMAGMIWMGWRAGGRNQSLDDYFVGGRNVSPWAAGISLLATLLSTISYLAYPGEVLSHGTGFLSQILVLPMVFVAVGYFLIPHIMRQPVSSAYELLETRLGPSVRTLGSVLFILLRVFWMAFILQTICSAMQDITGIPRLWLILGMGIITLIYTTEGGIRAVIWTDIAQFFVLFGGAVFTFLYLMHAGHLSAAELIRDGWNSTTSIPAWSLDLTQRTSVLNFLLSIGLWWIATCGSDQLAMQRFFTTRDAPTARHTLLINLVASIVTIFALAAIGLTLLHYFQANLDLLPAELRDFQKSGDKIFPYFIGHGMPVGLCGLVIAALFAAAMSSLSSGFNSLTAVLTVDFFHRGDKNAVQSVADGKQRRRAQWTTVIVGAIVMTLGFLLQYLGKNFFELSSRILDPLTGPLFGLFALAFFDRRASERSAWIGFGCGLVAGLLCSFGDVLFRSQQSVSFLLILPASILVTIGAGLISSRVLPAQPQ